MDPEKSSNSSFEDLSNLNENELKVNESSSLSESIQDDIIDILGNGQLTKRIIVKNEEGQRAIRGDICTINYVGKLENNTVVEEKRDFKIQVGDLEVVQGLDMAIPTMNIGETAEIVVHARFAYGSIGFKNEENPSASVPPGAKITYRVELLSCSEESDLDDNSFDSRKTIGNSKRERGNYWYSRNEYNIAIQLYRRALDYLDDTNLPETAATNVQLQEMLEIRIKVYNNLAAAQMKISAYDVALSSVETVLMCQPENVKALFRKGKILDATNETNLAIPVLQKAAMIDSESKAIQQLLSKCVLKSRREARNEKDLYQKMLGHTLKMEEKSKKSKLRDAANVPQIRLWGYVVSSILIGVVCVAIYRYKF